MAVARSLSALWDVTAQWECRAHEHGWIPPDIETVEQRAAQSSSCNRLSETVIFSLTPLSKYSVQRGALLM